MSEKSKRPANSAFKQQRLPAWQPILTAGTVLPTFFVIGILFIPVGIGLLFFSDGVKEVSYDYTDCIAAAGNSSGGGEKCSDVIQGNTTRTCECKPHVFNLKEPMTGRVYIYYALTNFYQNHRRYVRSRDDKQLLGKNLDDPDRACEPFRKDGGKYILPCGAIANSMFTDEIDLYEGNNKVAVTSKGIAWDSDKKYKFKNPPWFRNKNCADPNWKKYAKPKAWIKELCELDNGLENEGFIVWMRTAALPTFRKLYRKVVNEQGLKAGTYSLKISYSFSVKPFDGTKSIVISTASLLGGKNSFLGISYIVVGALCLILGIVFLFIHINFGKRNFVRPNEPHKGGQADGDIASGMAPAASAVGPNDPLPAPSTSIMHKRK